MARSLRLTKVKPPFPGHSILRHGLNISSEPLLEVPSFNPFSESSMKSSLLTIATAICALFAANAFAQKDVPGEARGASTYKASPAEKAEAKAERRAEGAAAVKAHQAGDDRPSTTASVKVSKSEKALAKAKRKSAGIEANKAPKDQSGPN
jgi:hypothetical protein